MKELLNKLFGPLLAAITASLAPIHTVMIATGALLVIDLITGIWAALKRKEKFSSAKLRQSITKMFLYQMAIISGFLMQSYLGLEEVPVVKVISSMIGMVEGTSVIENISAITGVDLLEKLKSLLNKKQP